MIFCSTQCDGWHLRIAWVLHHQFLPHAAAAVAAIIVTGLTLTAIATIVQIPWFHCDEVSKVSIVEPVMFRCSPCALAHHWFNAFAALSGPGPKVCSSTPSAFLPLAVSPHFASVPLENSMGLGAGAVSTQAAKANV
jgi:hypothetical protein